MVEALRNLFTGCYTENVNFVYTTSLLSIGSTPDSWEKALRVSQLSCENKNCRIVKITNLCYNYASPAMLAP